MEVCFNQTRYQISQREICTPARAHSLHLIGEEPARSPCARVFLKHTSITPNKTTTLYIYNNYMSFPVSTTTAPIGCTTGSGNLIDSDMTT